MAGCATYGTVQGKPGIEKQFSTQSDTSGSDWKLLGRHILRERVEQLPSLCQQRLSRLLGLNRHREKSRCQGDASRPAGQYVFCQQLVTDHTLVSLVKLRRKEGIVDITVNEAQAA